MCLTPESPKLMMADGRLQEALISFKRIYSMNKLKSRNSYPVIPNLLIE